MEEGEPVKKNLQEDRALRDKLEKKENTKQNKIISRHEHFHKFKVSITENTPTKKNKINNKKEQTPIN